LTSPIAIASSPSTTRPESNRSSARGGPTARARIQESPCSAISPRLENAVVSLASAAANRTSHMRAWTRPTPAHAPLMAAMTGLGIVSGKVCRRPWPAPRTPSRPMSCNASMSRAGAKAAAGARDDDHPHVCAMRAVVEHLEVHTLHLGGPRVKPLGTIERQQRDPILDRPQHDIGHRCSSLSSRKRTPPISTAPVNPLRRSEISVRPRPQVVAGERHMRAVELERVARRRHAEHVAPPRGHSLRIADRDGPPRPCARARCAASSPAPPTATIRTALGGRGRRWRRAYRPDAGESRPCQADRSPTPPRMSRARARASARHSDRRPRRGPCSRRRVCDRDGVGRLSPDGPAP